MTAIKNKPKPLNTLSTTKVKNLLLENFSRDQMRQIAKDLGVPQGRLVHDLAGNIANSPNLGRLKMSTTLVSG